MLDIHKANKILDAIRESQERDGGFYGYESKNKKQNKIQSIFVSSLVCRVLLEAGELSKYNENKLWTDIRKTVKETLHLIRKNRSSDGTWNYWLKESHYRKEEILPDDLDDTFNSLLAINLYNSEETSSETFLTVAKTLLSTERASKGLISYNTWLKDFEDIDPVIQVIVFKFLTKIRSVPSQFENYLEKVLSRIDKYIPKSKYYENELYILMELSSLPKAKKYISKFVKHLNKPPTDTFSKVLYYQIKNNLDLISTEDQKNILQLNFTDKELSEFYVEKDTLEEKTYCNSDVVKYAFALKLICSIKSSSKSREDLLDQTMKHNISIEVVKSTSRELVNYNQKLLNIEKSLFEGHSPLDNIISEVLEWAKYLKDSPLKNTDTIFIKKIVQHLYFGWIGYSSVDSVIDNQITKEYVVLGNHFTNRSAQIFQELIDSTYRDIKLLKEFQNYTDKIYQSLYKAYYIESKKDFKSLEDLIYVSSNKSIGHCLGFLILYVKYRGHNIKDLKSIHSYFYELLKMRQLSDDMHDWRDDQKCKRITYPTFLLKDIDKKYHTDSINRYIMKRVFKIMSESSVRMNQSVSKLSKIISPGDRFKIVDKSNKYLRGIRHAILEIDSFKK